MEQFTMTLNENFQRPMIYLNNWYGLNALLDTGALFPVWTAAEEVLQGLGGILIRRNIKFSGFGGETSGNLYRLQRISIGKLIFPELAVISCSELNHVPYHMILSATMFHNLTSSGKSHTSLSGGAYLFQQEFKLLLKCRKAAMRL